MPCDIRITNAMLAWAVCVAGTPSPASAGAPVIVEGRAFRCSPVAVWDGDGPVWCAEGPRLRLAGIAAREIDGSCRSGQPCPAASGIEARNRLVAILGGRRGVRPDGHVIVAGPSLGCVSEGSAKGDRTAAWCLLPDGQNLSCAMIETRTAVRWVRYDPANLCRAR